MRASRWPQDPLGRRRKHNEISASSISATRSRCGCASAHIWKRERAGLSVAAGSPRHWLYPGGNARLSFRIAVMAHQTNLVTFVLIVRIPTEGIKDFRAYEDAVLPLLPEFNGRLERRLRNPEGTIEMHIVSFASDADFQNYRNDPRRTAQAWLLEKSSAKLELLPMANVS